MTATNDRKNNSRVGEDAMILLENDETLTVQQEQGRLVLEHSTPEGAVDLRLTKQQAQQLIVDMVKIMQGMA